MIDDGFHARDATCGHKYGFALLLVRRETPEMNDAFAHCDVVLNW